MKNKPSTGSSKGQTQTSRTPIVAIGASAGGLEALKAFFASMPVDSGLAFIVITHIKPERESMLPELLANITAIPIVKAQDGMPLKSNQIVMAKDSLLNIAQGHLYAEKSDEHDKISYHPIDHFFRALADDQKEHSIAIILSGSGNDGSLGLKAIKSVGGMVMVQDSETAKYPGMPDSARMTGLVDYTLAPEEMPEALIEYCQSPYLRLASKENVIQLPDNAIRSILIRLKSYTGHDFTSYKKSTMSRRIERRMNVHHIEEPNDYIRLTKENPKELDALFKELLISVTSFFRDPEVFHFLEEKIIPDLLKDKDDGFHIRIWIPGCATGEEAYSLAIILDEQIRKTNRLYDVQIFATDLDKTAIDVARKGLYPQGIVADVSPERLKNYFTLEDHSFRIHKSIRERVIFAVQNVISDPPFTRMDLISCRNLLIYLDVKAQHQVLPALHYALRPGGLLVLGSSETSGNARDLFETIDSKNKILKKKEKPGHVYQPKTIIRGTRASHDMTQENTASVNQDQVYLTRGIEKLLLERFVPCAAIVDNANRLVYMHGRSGLYFEPEQGEPQNNILEMAREGLVTALITALGQARNQMTRIERQNIRVKTNGESVRVNLSVWPIGSPKSLRGLTVITLVPAPREKSEPHKKEQAPGSKESGTWEEMERDLHYTRENLQTTIEELETSNEELRSSNEELQSANEELQSTNEELETSKEEMQSLNEELNTVNSELESHVRQLARSNDDMNNLLNSMQVATVFVDNELRVKRYTEQAKNVIRLIESDIGRPLSDLSNSLDYDDLIEDCQQVLDTLRPNEIEIKDKNGLWYLVKLMPYRTTENLIDGVVISIVNIDRIKKAEKEKDKATLSRDFFMSIIETLREPLIVLNENLRIVIANDSWYKIFRTRPDETENEFIYELGNGQWDHPDLRHLLEDILSKDSIMTDFKISHDFPWIGHHTFLLNAKKLESDMAAENFILLVFKDIINE